MKHLAGLQNIQPAIAARVDEFLSHLPGVRDGSVESLHEARVASRRIRELLPLAGEDPRARAAEPVIVEAGRRLGHVRDLDVMIDTLDRKERTLPAAALAIAAARRSLRLKVDRDRRALVKALEELELGRVAALRDGRAPAAAAWRARLGSSARSYRPMVVDRISLRAHKLRTSVINATGLYFPNRVHAVRIATKQLRYIVEIAADTATWTPPHLLNDLKKIQTTLGALHDAEVLRGRVDALVEDVVPKAETSLLVGTLCDDITRLHADYLRRRERLLAIADACTRFASQEKPVAEREPFRAMLRLVRRAAS